MSIEVIGSNASGQAAPGAGAGVNEEVAEETGDDIFVNLSLSKRDVFLGEHIAVTVKIYTRVNFSGINEIKYPGFKDF